MNVSGVQIADDSKRNLDRLVSRWPGSIAALSDEQLVELSQRPPGGPAIESQIHAELFVRLWLYHCGQCPQPITEAAEGLKLSLEFEGAFLGATHLRKPEAESEPHYLDDLRAPDFKTPMESAIWKYLTARILDFLNADGIFPLVVGRTSAVAVPFNFSRSFLRPAEICDQTPTSLTAWTKEVEVLFEHYGHHLGASILCQFDPDHPPKGGSFCLALLLARERLRANSVEEFPPLEALVTGAFRKGRLHEVEDVEAKRQLAMKLGCAMFIAPSEQGTNQNDTIALNLSIVECLQEIGRRLKHVPAMAPTFHRASVVLEHINPLDNTTIDDLPDVEARLAWCEKFFGASVHPQARQKLDKCRMASLALQTLRDREQQRDSVGFTYTYKPGQVPDGLLPQEGFVGREEELRALSSRLTANAVVPVCGLPQSGKTALVAQCLNHDDVARTLRLHASHLREIALLYVDLKPSFGQHPVLRRLAHALGELKRFPDFREMESPNLDEVRTILLHEVIPSRFMRRIPLAVFDGLDCVAADGQSRADLAALVALPRFCDGAIVLLANGALTSTDIALARRDVKGPVELGPLKSAEAAAVLDHVLRNRTVAEEAIAEIKDMPELLFPGVLLDGAEMFKRNVRAKDHEPQSAALATAILDAGEKSVLDVFGLQGCPWSDEPSGPSGDQFTLMAMAVLARQPVTVGQLRTSNLPLAYFEVLQQKGLLAASDGPICLPALMCTGLRRRIEKSSKDSPSMMGQLAGVVEALIRAVEEDSPGEATSLAEAIEESLAWITSRLPNEAVLSDRLRRALLPHVANDLVFPFSAAESEALQQRLNDSTGLAGLDTVIASLVMDARFGSSASRLLSCLERAMNLVNQSARLTARQLRDLDDTAFTASHRHHLFRPVLQLRRDLSERLLGWTADSADASAAFRRAAASWLMNTADLGFQLQEPLQWVAQLHGRAGELIADNHTEPAQEIACEVSWLRSRHARLAAYLSHDQKERTKYLREAVAEAAIPLPYGNGETRRAQIYLRALDRLLQELPEQDQRETALQNAAALMGRTYASDQSAWPMEVRAEFAALLRDEAGLSSNSHVRIERLRNAAEFLGRFKTEILGLADEGDGRPLLVLSRIHRSLGRECSQVGQHGPAEKSLTEAVQLADAALRSCPNVQAWTVRLTLLDAASSVSDRTSWSQEGLDGSQNDVSDELRSLVKRCRDWIKAVPRSGVAVGHLALYCFQLEWRAQGGLWDLAQPGHLAGDQVPDHLTAEEKRRLLVQHYSRRRAKLEHVQRKYGCFLDLALAEIRLEAQMQHDLALLREDRVVDNQKTMVLFRRAGSNFPDSLKVCAEEARFFRWVWNHAEAIPRFRTVVERTRDAVERREVAVQFVEALLSAAVHFGAIRLASGDELRREQLIEQARFWLSSLFSYSDVEREVAILRDQVELEAGGAVDWVRNDQAFDLTVGGPDGYCHTISEHLEDLRGQVVESSERLWQSVVQNFTHVDVLRGLGRLYLRCAQLNASSHPLRDVERAYGCFNACRILEQAERGRELAVTAFQRAACIILGVTISGEVNPFKIDRGKYSSELDLAEARLQSAIARSVGGFHEVILRKRAELKELRVKRRAQARAS